MRRRVKCSKSLERRKSKQREPPESPCTSEVELDRISSLPGHIIDQILLQLPIRDAVRTSVLSSKWRYNWATLPSLVFDTKCISLTFQDQAAIKSKLVNIVNHVLLLHIGPICKFKLSCLDPIAITEINQWILHLSRSPIREFALNIWNLQPYKLHSCLFSCQNLTCLELDKCLLEPPPTFQGFKNLKSLNLHQVTMGQEVFDNLISRSHLLERLTLIRCNGFGHLNINAPNLFSFVMGGAFDDVSFTNTFQLTQVCICLYAVKHISRPLSTSNLVKFFVHLRHIRRLKIYGFLLKYLAVGDVPSRLPSPCLDLAYLTIDINFDDWEENKAALYLLRSSPNLQELDIVSSALSLDGPPNESYKFWEGKHQSCMFNQLRIVRLSHIYEARLQLDFTSFLLLASPVLERMAIEPGSTDEGWPTTKELLRLRRASVQAEIVYEDQP